MKASDIISGGELIGTVREALRRALEDRPELGLALTVPDYLEALARAVARDVAAIEMRPLAGSNSSHHSPAWYEWALALANREAERDASGLRRGSLGREDNLAAAVRDLLDERITLRSWVAERTARAEAAEAMLAKVEGGLSLATQVDNADDFGLSKKLAAAEARILAVEAERDAARAELVERELCVGCGMPAHASETDDHGRCRDCIRAAGEEPIEPGDGQ